MVDHEKPFGRARKFFWPIHGSEVKKFLPMSIMMFFILFNYTVLRNTKDALIITSVGAEAVPFLKGVVILPISFLLVTFYAKLLNTFKVEVVFYIAISLFISFFTFFALYLYPNQDFIQPSPESINYLKTAYPHFQHLISLGGAWVFASFYVFAELWGTIALGLLFWQFANEVTRIPEAKRFYAMFGLLGHFALIAAGRVIKHLCAEFEEVSVNGRACEEFMNSIILLVVIAAFIIMLIYRWLHVYVLTDPQYYDAAVGGYKKEATRPKFSLAESLRHIMTSKYIGLIALLVLGYGFSMNILGLLWKGQLKLQYLDTIKYQNFMADFSTIIGLVTIILIFFFKVTVARYVWSPGYIVMPIVL